MDELSVKFLDIPFKNPILTASGTFGFGEDYQKYYNPEILGGFVTKGLTLNKSEGNSGIRLSETPMGLLNSIGLENPGVDYFIDKIYPDIKNIKTNLIINLGGHSFEDYSIGAEKLNQVDCAFIELNLSCPNLNAGGMAFGVDKDKLIKVVAKVKDKSRHKIVVKLSPNVTSITDLAKAARDAGADGLSLINTLVGLAIDIKREKLVFDKKTAGLSGPAIKPVALAQVYQVSKTVEIPIIGIGGISTYEDVLEFLMAGASLVEIGTANFVNPNIPEIIIKKLKDYCNLKKKRITDFVGIV